MSSGRTEQYSFSGDNTLVTVVIVNWNSGDLLAKCLDKLGEQTLAPTKTIVVDNSSGDDLANVAHQLQGVTLLKSTSNRGFAAGNNLAFEEIGTKYIALLNPDAFPVPTWLEKLVFEAEKRPDVAAFGSRQMLYGADGVIDGLGDVYHLSGLVWRSGHGRQLSVNDVHNKAIFSPCAGAALYRTEALRLVGGFDEDFFCYVEDVDLGFRLRLAGYRSMLVADAVVDHVGSATTGGKHSDFAVYYGHRNLVWAYIKNMPGWMFWAFLPLHMLMNVVAVVRFALSGQAGVIIKAKKEALLGVPEMWKKRRLVQRQRMVSVAQLWKIMNKRLWPRR